MVVSALVGESFRSCFVSALSRFGPISIETEVVYGKDRGGCCWWGGVDPISIGIETNERNDRRTDGWMDGRIDRQTDRHRQTDR